MTWNEANSWLEREMECQLESVVEARGEGEAKIGAMEISNKDSDEGSQPDAISARDSSRRNKHKTI